MTHWIVRRRLALPATTRIASMLHRPLEMRDA